MNFNYQSISTQNGISIDKLSLTIGNKCLLDNTELVISQGYNYGLISPNGHGKTTLLNFISEKIKLDGGNIHMVKQENESSEKSVIEELLSSHIDYQTHISEEARLTKKIINCENETEIIKINEKLNKLNEWALSNNLKTVKPRAFKILYGIGFDHNSPDGNMQLKKVNEYSGGWRMRITIAKALLNEPNILILDEPTNHLDLNAVIWLGNYLQAWNKQKNTRKKTLIIVSHNKYFLDDVVDKILRIHDKTIMSYTGNHEKMLKMIVQERKQINKKWEKDKKHIKSKKEKKKKRPDDIYKVDFNFCEDIYMKGSITLNNVSFTYNKDKIIFSAIDFCIRCGEKIAVIGRNGSGKSTLLNILNNELNIEQGHRTINNVKIGKYSQHFDNVLPMDKTPVEFLHSIFTDWSITDIRKHLSKYNLDSKAHNVLIKDCSGGQKSRIAFSTLSEADILILDEPTNHLDLESIDALCYALDKFEGGVVLVSHDARLITELECQLYICRDNKLIKYSGDFEDYKTEILDEIEN